MKASMIRGLLLCCVDAIFLSRPLLLIPVWGFAVFGYVSGSRGMGCPSLFAGWHAPISVAWWIFVFSLSVGAVYVFNQVADREVDAANAGFPLLAKGNIPLWLAWIGIAAFSLASILVPLCRRPELAIFSVLAMLTGFLYSAKPFYFSGRPMLDFLANASGYGLVAFGTGWHLAGAYFGSAFLASCAPYFFLMCAGSISSTLPDYDGDRKHGKNTTAVWLGPILAHRIACSFIALGITIAIIVHDWPAALCAGIAAPFYVAHGVLHSKKTMEASYKIGGMILMLAAAALFPYLVPASILLLVATIVYFRLRFHVRYPSLVPDSPKN